MVTLFKVLIFVSWFSSMAAVACMGRILPDKNFDVYESIFLGQVTGIHLTKYQERMVEGLKSDEGFTSWTDTTPNM
jgi:hypothetical protein